VIDILLYDCTDKKHAGRSFLGMNVMNGPRLVNSARSTKSSYPEHYKLVVPFVTRRTAPTCPYGECPAKDVPLQRDAQMAYAGSI